MEAMTTTMDTFKGIHKERVAFDTDLVLLRVDNCWTASMLPHKSVFIGRCAGACTEEDSRNRWVVQHGIMMGTLKFLIKDDIGAIHDIIISKSF
jgi:hypothetical protein